MYGHAFVYGTQFVTEIKNFEHIHKFHINSVSQAADGEAIISSDDTTVNLWNIEDSITFMNVVDKTPVKIETISEVITSSTVHPT